MAIGSNPAHRQEEMSRPARSGRRTSSFYLAAATAMAALAGAPACEDSRTEPPVSPEQIATTVRVSPARSELTALGDTVRLTAEVLDQNGQAIVWASVRWSSSNPEAATVDGSGLVTAVLRGVADIVASYGNLAGLGKVAVTSHPDLDALGALYEATNGDDWRSKSSWLSDRPLGQWYGVETNGEGRVVAVDLADNDLSGPIPPELGQLTNLQYLDLAFNDLSGSIPPELGQLTNLRYLRLGRNRLSGPIPPGLEDLQSLVHLWLGNNELTGPIPPELADLRDLVQLWLGGNDLSGLVPPQLGRLRDLEVLSLEGNALTGPIPPQLGQSTSLQALNLAFNDLSGLIPPELGEMTNLGFLYLPGNNLTGPIPPALGALTKLRALWLGGNDLTGPIPPELSDLRDLVDLFLEGNDLSGPIPLELGNLRSLQRLFLGFNSLAGQLPTELGRLKSLTALDLRNNTELAGPLPESLTGVPLDTLWAENTDLCMPEGPTFTGWANGIHSLRMARCEGAASAGARLNRHRTSRLRGETAQQPSPQPSFRRPPTRPPSSHGPEGSALPQRSR